MCVCVCVLITVNVCVGVWVLMLVVCHAMNDAGGKESNIVIDSCIRREWWRVLTPDVFL